MRCAVPKEEGRLKKDNIMSLTHKIILFLHAPRQKSGPYPAGTRYIARIEGGVDSLAKLLVPRQDQRHIHERMRDHLHVQVVGT